MRSNRGAQARQTHRVERGLSTLGRGKGELKVVLEDVIRVSELGEVPAGRVRAWR